MSPYLFVIVMEAFSNHPDFKFHWKTKQCKITHLCFADDLIVFCHGNVKSVSVVKDCINLFSQLSGLIPNTSKSLCYLANVPMEQKESILHCLGFQLGTFPAKLLGVPPISSKLSCRDCIPLVGKITARISSWTNVFLSYSGRIQLIKSVLFC